MMIDDCCRATVPPAVYLPIILILYKNGIFPMLLFLNATSIKSCSRFVRIVGLMVFFSYFYIIFVSPTFRSCDCALQQKRSFPAAERTLYRTMTTQIRFRVGTAYNAHTPQYRGSRF